MNPFRNKAQQQHLFWDDIKEKKEYCFTFLNPNKSEYKAQGKGYYLILQCYSDERYEHPLIIPKEVFYLDIPLKVLSLALDRMPFSKRTFFGNDDMIVSITFVKENKQKMRIKEMKDMKDKK